MFPTGSFYKKSGILRKHQCDAIVMKAVASGGTVNVLDIETTPKHAKAGAHSVPKRQQPKRSSKFSVLH